MTTPLRRPKRYDADTFRGWEHFKIKVMSRAGYAALRIDKRESCRLDRFWIAPRLDN